jgi:putative ABC transport system permease protein
MPSALCSMTSDFGPKDFGLSMLKNYFKVAFRNLLKHRTFSAINIFCLAIGLACCILIFLFVQHEWQHDRFHKNAGDIYRLVMASKRTAGSGFYLNTLFPDKFSEELVI